MPTLDINPLKDVSNIDIINAIRRDASPAYQSRIPEATQANIQETLRSLTNNRTSWNEFQDALINRIGMVIARNKVWSNPLAKFKRGMLEYGDTIEEIMVGLIEAREYNTDRESMEKDLFGTHTPDVQASYHKINRANFYPITVNQALLKRAFIGAGDLTGFVNQVLSSPTTSDQWDEFLLIANLFKLGHENGNFFKVNVPDVGAQGSTAEDAKFFLRRIREYAGILGFLSTHYNPAGMPTFAEADELELFITPTALAAIDVEALAGAFNIDKANMIGKVTIVPEEYFDIPGVQAILTVRDFFVIADSVLETASQWNPAKLQNNYFLHHQEVISASRFVPQVLFTTEDGDSITLFDPPVTSISSLSVVNSADTVVTSVIRGLLFQLLGNAVTTPAGGDNDAVRMEVVSNTAGVNLSSRTYITQDGVLHVGYDEAATSIILNVYSVDDNTIKATETLAVVGDLMTLYPNPSVSTDSDDDGLFEVTPEVPTSDPTAHTVTIPTVTGVQYQNNGSNVANGSVISYATVTAVITATARSGNELAAGAPATWTYTHP